MPSTYAHFKAGQAVRAQLQGDARRVVEAHLPLYQIGLHGPDILFYYKPYGKNRVNRTGYRPHEKSGASFFSFAAKALRSHPQPDAALAYLYGVVCHFALDVTCHGYIAAAMARTGLSHAEVEVELDRALLARDGMDPVRAHLAGHIAPTRENAAVIQDFYPGVSAEEVYKALRGFVFYSELLRAPSPLKRRALMAAFRAAGCWREMHGMVVNYRPDPRCVESTARLLELYEQGEALALRLAEEYGAYLSGAAPLDAVYRFNFESEKTADGGEQDEIQTDEG